MLFLGVNMKIRILKDKKFSVDGINTLSFCEDDIEINLPAEILNAIEPDYEIVKEAQSNNAKKTPAKKAAKKAPRSNQKEIK